MVKWIDKREKIVIQKIKIEVSIGNNLKKRIQKNKGQHVPISLQGSLLLTSTRSSNFRYTARLRQEAFASRVTKNARHEPQL